MAKQYLSTKAPIRSTFAVGDRIGYAKLFLRSIATPATDPSWRRKGVIVAIAGDSHPSYTHWKTGEVRPLPAEFVLVQWDDEPGEIKLLNNTAVAKVGGIKWAEDV